MNKSLKYLLFTALTVSVASVSATNSTAHTYLNRRPVNVNLPMELTTFNERMQANLDDRFGGNLQISGFYGETNSDDDAGAYFGINNKGNYVLMPSSAVATPSTVDNDFDLGYIIHQYNLIVDVGNPAIPATISLDPESKSYGARFDYYQNMDKLLKGLYLKVNTTVVHVENNMEMTVKNTNAVTQTNLQKFFNGTFTGLDTVHNEQATLAYGKMTGEHTETGLADIDVILGYKFLEKAKYHAGINLGVTIPTGKKPSGRYLFEPVYGNHSHVGFGGGLDAHVNLWTKGKQDIKLNFVANYRYLFEASEYRPLKLTSKPSPYVLLGTLDSAVLTPAVNILTPYGVSVTPGSQFDGVLALAYNCGGFSADLGYNLYARSEEDVDFKGILTSNTYGIAARNYNTIAVFSSNNIEQTPAGAAGSWLSNSDVDTDAASTPSQITNGIYGGLGYHFKNWEYPFLLGLGGKYDWASKNSEFDSWSVWAKVSLSF